MTLSNLMKSGVFTVALVVVAPTAFAQEDAGFTAVEKSAEGLQEAILMTASKLVQVYGGDAVGPATLTFNGIFTDGSWQADFSGDYAGEPVALDFTGTYDDSKNAGAFTVTGTYGSATWDGDGSWRYDIVDPQTIHMFWDSAASITDQLGRLFKPDKHFTTPKKWVMSRLLDGGRHVVDSGEYRTTYFGIPVGPPQKEDSDWVYPPGGSGGGIATVAVSLPDDGIQLSGSADFAAGTFTGMVNLTPVPEVKGEEAKIAGLGTDSVLEGQTREEFSAAVPCNQQEFYVLEGGYAGGANGQQSALFDAQRTQSLGCLRRGCNADLKFIANVIHPDFPSLSWAGGTLKGFYTRCK